MGNGGEPTIREFADRHPGEPSADHPAGKTDEEGVQADASGNQGAARRSRPGWPANLRELCDLQREMRGQMRAMIWIMGVIGGVTVLAVLAVC